MMTTSAQANSTGLARDMDLIEQLASDRAHGAGGLRVSELAQLVGRSKSVVSRALSTLASAGLVDRNPETQAYRIGTRLFAIAARSADSQLVQAGRPVLAELVRRTQETAHLCVLSHGNELTLSSELSPHELRSAGWQGVTAAAWRTSSGRVLLSQWDDETLREWYRNHGKDAPVIRSEVFNREPNPFELLDEPRSRVFDVETLLVEVALVRAQGFALLDEEFEAGVFGISAPVFSHTGGLVAALNVSGPKVRIAGQEAHLIRTVRAAAWTLSRSLGHRPTSRQHAGEDPDRSNGSRLLSKE